MAQKKSAFNASRGGVLSFVAVMLAAYAVLYGEFGLRPVFFQLGLLALVYTGIGTLVWNWLLAHPAPIRQAAYFIVQFILGAILATQSQGAGWLALIPLVSQAFFILPRWIAIAFTALVLVVELVPFLPLGLTAVIPAGMSFLAALTFVAIFSLITFSEQEARAEVERLAAELGEANRKLREYAVQVEELAVTQERNRLAREIHDGLGHYLTAVNMQIKAAQATFDQDRGASLEALGKAQSMAQEALADVRRSVSALRLAPTEKRPLAEAIAELVASSRSGGIDCDLEVRGTPQPLSPQVDLALYRAAQEGLTNVQKHAQASQARVRLEYGPEQVSLSVQDNGPGGEDTDGGFGLLGLRERALLLGGQVRTTSSPGEGFRLEMTLPCSTGPGTEPPVH